MPTIIRFPSVATNLPSGAFNASNWVNPSFALTNDGISSYNDFNAGAGSGKSNYLYFSGFNCSFPTAFSLNGITVTFEKNAAGTIQDYFIGLVYNVGGNPTVIFPGRQVPGNWLNIPQTVNYGSSTDVWNKLWLPTELNDPIFGVVIAVQGNVSDPTLPTAMIDWLQVTIDWFQGYNETGSGGALASGSASVSTVFAPFSPVPAGVWANGMALKPVFVTLTPAGVWTNGAAVRIELVTAADGGVFGGGIADRSHIMDPALLPGEFSFICSAEYDIPPDPAPPGYLAVVRMLLNGSTFSWHIEHNFEHLDNVRVRGPASETGVAPTQIAIDFLQPVNVTPIIGSTTVDVAQQSQILNGQWYLFLRENTNHHTIRGQIENKDIRAGGTAYMEAGKFVTTSGGVQGSGSATVVYITSPATSTGGVYANGKAFLYTVEDVSGGSYGNGSATLLYVSSPDISGGVQGSGSALIVCTYAVPSGTDGPLVSDVSGIIAIGVIATGGSYGNGTADEVKISPIIGSGGAKCSGSLILTQLYASQPILGGVRAGSTTIIEYLKFYITNKHIGYALLMKSPNILNTPKPTNEIIVNPHIQPTPFLPADAFKIDYSPGWCDVGETCTTAVLPKIIQNRQNGILPPKAGQSTQIQGQIATFTTSN